MEQRTQYHELLGIKFKIDPVVYRKKFRSVTKNAGGIPLHLEEEADKRGQILATSYEALYDRNKLAIQQAGLAFSQLLRTDTGGLVSSNHAAVMTIPPLVKALEQGDNPLWAVVSLHWLRSREDSEWIFSHLCESVHAYYSVQDIRDQLGTKVEVYFDDMRDHLKEALYQFDHRHC